MTRLEEPENPYTTKPFPYITKPFPSRNRNARTSRASKVRMQSVNRRVHEFFQSPKYVQGVYAKIDFTQLRITQVRKRCYDCVLVRVCLMKKMKKIDS